MIKNKKIHIIGIAGVGGSAIAALLKDMGNQVSGSDEGFYEPTVSYLKKAGIKILSPYKKENIPPDTDLIIVGKHSKLHVDSQGEGGNEEVKFALTQKDKVRSFPQVLGEMTRARENIVVAGSYGKSTCSALMAWCLLEKGLPIGYFFGAIPLGFDKSAQIGTDKHFIMEGDEYPAFGGVSKFLYLNPKDILLTSAEHDHVNIFPTEESYLAPYKELLKLLVEDSLLVTGINNPNIKKVTDGCEAKIVTYGMQENCDWYPGNIRYGAKTVFDLCRKGKKVTELSTSLLGAHNIENIVGVSAYLLEKNLITTEELRDAVDSFGGLRRRLDLKTDKSSVLVYEGFGSSYQKAKTVFEALKLHFPDRKIITVFEPHTFSWRNKDNLNWYKDIFKESSETIIFEPPEHGKDTHNQASLEEILKEVRKTKPGAYGVKDKNEALDTLNKVTNKGDVIILMSSGDLGGLIEEIPLWAEKKFPKL